MASEEKFRYGYMQSLVITFCSSDLIFTSPFHG